MRWHNTNNRLQHKPKWFFSFALAKSTVWAEKMILVHLIEWIWYCASVCHAITVNWSWENVKYSGKNDAISNVCACWTACSYAHSHLFASLSIEPFLHLHEMKTTPTKPTLIQLACISFCHVTKSQRIYIFKYANARIAFGLHKLWQLDLLKIV